MAEAFHDPYDEMSDEEFDSYIATLIQAARQEPEPEGVRGPDRAQEE